MSGVKLQSANINKFYRGTDQVSKVFLGSTKLWPSCDEPPYFCSTEVDTSCVSNFAFAWSNCINITSFPLLDLSSGTNFRSTWSFCSNLVDLLEVNVSSGTTFESAWWGCSSLQSFPALNMSNSISFYRTWRGCTSLVDFPPNMFDTCQCVDFYLAWENCALSQQSVDNILISLDTANQSNGVITINGGTSSLPSSIGDAAVASLLSKGWSISLNI